MIALVDGIATINLRLNDSNLAIPSRAVGVSRHFIRSKPLDFGRPDLIKTVAFIRLDLAEDDTGLLPDMLRIRLGWQLNMSDPIEWSRWEQITSFHPRIPFGVSGKFITFELSDEFPFIQWKLTNIEFYGPPFPPEKTEGATNVTP